MPDPTNSHSGHLTATPQLPGPIILRFATRNFGKQAGELRRTVDADLLRHLGYRHIRGQQQGLRPLDPAVLHVKAGRRAHHLLEHLGKVPRRQACPVRQLGQGDMPLQMVMDIVHDVVELAIGCRTYIMPQHSSVTKRENNCIRMPQLSISFRAWESMAAPSYTARL